MTAAGMIWWSTSTATVGLIVQHGVVVDCPPYASRWARRANARDLWRTGVRRGMRPGIDLIWLPDAPTKQALQLERRVDVPTEVAA